MTILVVRGLAMVSVSLLLLGCGPSRPALVPVKGQVRLDGKPLPLKNIAFVPELGTPGLGAGANTREDGSYELIAVYPGAVKDMLGVPAGSYKVIVSEPMFPIETSLPVQGETDEPEVAIDFSAPAAKKGRLTIPPAYTDESLTPLRAQVPETGGEINLDLSSKS